MYTVYKIHPLYVYSLSCAVTAIFRCLFFVCLFCIIVKVLFLKSSLNESWVEMNSKIE